VLVALIGVAELALVGFALAPAPWSALFMLAKTHQAAGDLSAASTRLKRAVELNRYLLQTDTGKRDGAKFETQLNELLDALNRNTNDPLK
jgi:hypothetical protein